MEMSRIPSDAQATIPAAVQDALGIRPGDTLVWHVSNGVARVWKDAEELAFLKLAEESFAEEWLSAEDEEAWRDL